VYYKRSWEISPVRNTFFDEEAEEILVYRRFPKDHTMKEPQRVEELPFSRISASAC